MGDGITKRLQIAVGSSENACILLKLEVFVINGLLTPFGLGHVSCDFSKPLQAAAFFEYGGNLNVGPNLLSVLAHPPALLICMTLLHGRPEFLFGLTLRNGFRRIEAGKVLADDLVSLVALDALRAFVPADDVPLGAKHEDRTILYTLD